MPNLYSLAKMKRETLLFCVDATQSNHRLENFESAIDMLKEFNTFSQNLYGEAEGKFQKHTRMAKEMRADLENIMYRTR